MKYDEFIDKKSQMISGDGFEYLFMPDYLFDFQKYITEKAISGGRNAVFADCGLGKTPMQLVWGENIIRKTNKPVLLMAPLSVSHQTIEESEKFKIDCFRSMDGKHTGKKIIVTNYEKLHYFNPDDFSGVICDESSIIKNFNGSRKQSITDFMKKIKYRLLCTATASPNDYTELGTSSEALGHLGYMDMLSMFFTNNENSLHPAFIGTQWRLKPYAEKDFWRWLSSWSIACRKPSDLGFKNNDFVLPELKEIDCVIKSPARFGELFASRSNTLSEQREDCKNTIGKRCEIAAEKLSTVNSGIAWCNLNAESDLLEKLIPGSKQVRGSDSDEKKDSIFNDFKKGLIRVVVTKPRIAAFGMNWQHCNNMTYFVTHSFEQKYQAIRRCWRFGQKYPVTVYNIITDSQDIVLQNLKRKEKACLEMFESIIDQMNNSLKVKRSIIHDREMEVPVWL